MLSNLDGLDWGITDYWSLLLTPTFCIDLIAIYYFPAQRTNVSS